MAIAFLLLLMAAATLVQDSSGLTCRCAASRTPGRTHSFCDLDMPNGCAECEGDVAAERAYRQLEAILSRTLDVVLQGRDKNCCLVSLCLRYDFYNAPLMTTSKRKRRKSAEMHRAKSCRKRRKKRRQEVHVPLRQQNSWS